MFFQEHPVELLRACFSGGRRWGNTLQKNVIRFNGDNQRTPFILWDSNLEYLGDHIHAAFVKGMPTVAFNPKGSLNFQLQ